MMKNACEHERAVIESLNSGASADEISAHLAACADCRETARIVSFFQSNLKNEPVPKQLPTAGLVWWKSRLREKQHAARRARQPILIVQIIAAVVCAAAFVWLYNNGFDRFLALDRLQNSADKIFFPVFAAVVCFLIICSTLIVTLRRYLLEK